MQEEGGDDPCSFEESSLYYSGLDLFQDAFMAPYQGANPVIGCLTGAAVSTARAGRDCVSLPNPDGCGPTIESNVIGTGLGCVPYVGEVLGLGWGAKGVIDNVFNYYDCTQNHDPIPTALERHANRGEAGAASSLERHTHTPPGLLLALEFLTLQIEVSRVASNLTATIYGSPNWSGPKSPEDAVPYEAFFALLQASVGANSPAGAQIDGAEQAQLLALDPPAGVTGQDVETAIDRVEAIANGALVSDQALRLELAAAYQEFLDVVEPLEAAGWPHLLYGLEQALVEISKLGGAGTSGGPKVVVPLAAPARDLARHGPAPADEGVEPRMYRFPRRALYYHLRNQLNGFEQRGRLSTTGRFIGLILAPETPYRVTYFDPQTSRMGRAYFVSGSAGQSTPVPAALMFKSPGPDSDGDGLADVVERLLGTNPLSPDSDSDGASDAVEIRTGSNPLDGFPIITGVVGRSPTPGAICSTP